MKGNLEFYLGGTKWTKEMAMGNGCFLNRGFILAILLIISSKG